MQKSKRGDLSGTAGHRISLTNTKGMRMTPRQDLETTRRAMQVLVNGYNARNPDYPISDVDSIKHRDNTDRTVLVEVKLQAIVWPDYAMGKDA
jgi:hypothetical protein